MTITTYTRQGLTNRVIAWFLSRDGEELAEMIYKNCASSPHYPPFTTEEVIDNVVDGARTWCESGPDCEKIPLPTNDPGVIDWRQVAVAIVAWYRGPAPEGEFPAVANPEWDEARLARAWDQIDAAVKSA